MAVDPAVMTDALVVDRGDDVRFRHRELKIVGARRRGKAPEHEVVHLEVLGSQEIGIDIENDGPRLVFVGFDGRLDASGGAAVQRDRGDRCVPAHVEAGGDTQPNVVGRGDVAAERALGHENRDCRRR